MKFGKSTKINISLRWDFIQGLRDETLLQLAYYTLWHYSELIALVLNDLVITTHGTDVDQNILLRKSKGPASVEALAYTAIVCHRRHKAMDE